MRCILFILFAATSWAQEAKLSVSSPDWEIIGKIIQIQDSKVDQFTGIPYDEPLVGNSRFKKPLSLKEFPKKLKATNQAPTTSEDPTTKKAVMIWVYGGAFLTGSISFPFYNELALAGLGDVVVVTVNYRVGSFGLLTAGTADEPGNLALYDQQLAFTWVKDNIHHFGGDPSKITIFGESAGGVSISAHVTSPKSKGLFQRAIIQSGTTFNSNYFLRKDTLLKKSEKVAKYSGCLENDVSLASNSDQVLKCLRSKSPEVLLQVEYQVMDESDKYDQMGIIFDEEFLDYKSLFPFRPSTVNEAQLMIGVTKD
ncbi:BCHE [Cordylochernes scorpioides]|uniref:Carboxylic ester hydrolase n=1 Tax=Cordylochernes scorpioides TaxID=51811 RepID=A0ABY6K1E5_9ARAC|nr:BCHE [Cordylochernes scorpioides]